MLGNEPPPVVNVEGVSFSFSAPDAGTISALEGVTVSVGAREIVALVGPSGCGKSTLLRLIEGTLDIQTGVLSVFGEKPRFPNPRVFCLEQEPCLLPYRTVAENVLLVQGFSRNKEVGTSEGLTLLKEAGLSDWAHRFPDELSGGMRHIVALLAAVCSGSPLLLLDEPFSGLDVGTRVVIEGILRRAVRQRVRTAIVVTHEIESAVALGDRIIVLGKRPGKIISEIMNRDITDKTEHDPMARPPAFWERCQVIWRLIQGQYASEQCTQP